jgi:hypothetical protein
MLDRSGRPSQSGPGIWVRRLKANEHANFVILGNHVEDYWTHWDGENTVPCITPHEMCPGHKQGWPRRYKGFLHVWDTQRRLENFLELTPVAVTCLLEALPPEQKLRGIRLSVKRGAGKKARLVCTVWQGVSHEEMDQLPQPKCPTTDVLKLWKVDMGSLGL